MAIVYKESDSQTGVKSVIHDLGDKVVYEKQYDAQPFLDVAQEMRQVTEGQKWGEMRHVGFIPAAEYATMLRQDGRLDKKRVHAWLKKNPKLVTFSKFLKA